MITLTSRLLQNILTSGFGTDNTIQTIWAVPPGIDLTDSDNTVMTGLTRKCINRCFKWHIENKT